MFQLIVSPRYLNQYSKALSEQIHEDTLPNSFHNRAALRGSCHGHVLSKESDRHVYLMKTDKMSAKVSKGNPAMMKAMVYQD